MFSRVERTDRSVFERCTVCVKRCMLEVHLVVFVWNTRWTKLMCVNQFSYSSTRTQILPRFLPKYRIKNLRKTVIFFVLFSFFFMNAKISWFKNGSWANWLDLVFLEQRLCCFSADTHLISFVTEQTKMRQPPTNSSPIALRLYAIVRVVLLLVWLQLRKAAYPYCIVTFTLPVYTDIVLLYDFNSRKWSVFKINPPWNTHVCQLCSPVLVEKRIRSTGACFCFKNQSVDFFCVCHAAF